MRTFSLSSVMSQLLLLFFVVIWIVPTFGLFISSLRDKDLLAISGWWTSLKTTQVNEIYRSAGSKEQIQENDLFLIKGNIFEDDSNKKIISYGVNSKNINEFDIEQIGVFKDGTKIQLFENGNYILTSSNEFKKKRKEDFRNSLKSTKIYIRQL